MRCRRYDDLTSPRCREGGSSEGEGGIRIDLLSSPGISGQPEIRSSSRKSEHPACGGEEMEVGVAAPA
jgi:hypothetical protein